MTSSTRSLRRAARALLMATLALWTLSGCTIIRESNNNNNNNEPQPPPPKVVDMLVMVELDRSATSMADSYQQILATLTLTLAEQNVTIRKAALAPMYRRAGNTVPLIYGMGDELAEFSDFGQAIFFFANDDGQRYLRDRADSDGENLAALGLELDTRPIYRPTTSDSNTAPYFTTPADGFLVVQITAKARACGYSDAACQLNGQSPADYFTQRDDQDTAAWLELGGQQSLKRDKIFHLLIATAERMDIDTFISKCERQPMFPAGKLDYMEPSQKPYYEPLAEQLNAKGGRAHHVDMCTAMSPLAGLAAMKTAANKVRAMF